MTGAEVANALFVAAIIVYATAMFAYALEYAFDKRAPKHSKVLVAAGESTGSDIGSEVPTETAAPISPAAA
ncbi:MAG TPA: hypothetical protein VKZ65_03415, partial [Glycomyces sp.]|nr:hypothetical protein [Glycomyces sp.]